MKKSISAVALLSSLVGASPVFASVTYSFNDNSFFSDTFTYVSPDFIKTATIIDRGSLSSCNLFLSFCGSVEFSTNTSVFGTSYDQLNINGAFLGFLPFSIPEDFQLGAFEATGRYTSTTGATLDVSTAVSSVPLPASAPMFGAALLALGAVGFGRKRKAKAAA